MKEIDKVLNSIKKIVGNRNLIVSDWAKEPFLKGWRYGEGNALAVVKPEKLIEMWEVLELCVKNDLIIIMQAANTGLTGGSTPDGKNYDREIIDKWDEKIDAIIKGTLQQDVRSLSGVPSWMLTLMNKLLETTGKKYIDEIWKNLEVFFHGGVSFKPYKNEFNNIISNKNIRIKLPTKMFSSRRREKIALLSSS